MVMTGIIEEVNTPTIHPTIILIMAGMDLTLDLTQNRTDLHQAQNQQESLRKSLVTYVKNTKQWKHG